MCWDFPGGFNGKESACNAGDLGSIPGSGRSPGEGNDTLLQYSCLENSMGSIAWWVTVHVVAKSQKWLSDWGHTPHDLTSYHLEPVGADPPTWKGEQKIKGKVKWLRACQLFLGEQRLKCLANSMPFSSPWVSRPAELKEQRECLP